MLAQRPRLDSFGKPRPPTLLHVTSIAELKDLISQWDGIVAYRDSLEPLF